MQLVHQVGGELEACADALTYLREEAAASASAVGLDWTDSPARIRDLADVARRLVGHPDIPAHWLSRPAPGPTRERLRELESEWSAVAAAVRELEQRVGAGWSELPESDHRVIAEALRACREAPVAWRLQGSSEAAHLARAARLADELVRQLPWVEAQASRLARAFGCLEIATLRQALALGELGAMIDSRHRPESAWLSPIALPPVQAVARALAALVPQYLTRRASLTDVFTERVIELDLETLSMRFEHVYRGPLTFLKSGYRADRRLLASATRLGRVDGRVRARLRDALKWQGVTAQLAQAERQHAGVIGGRYYRREETDFEALTEAVEIARRAVELAESRVDPASLARQLAVDGTPDPAALAAGQDVLARLGWLRAEAEALVPESVRPLLDAPLADVRRSAELVRAPLQDLVTVVESVAGAAGRSSTLEEARHALELRARVAATERRLAASEATDDERLGPAYRGAATDWTALGKALDWSVELRYLTGEVADDTAARLLSASVDPEPLTRRLVTWEKAIGALLARFQRDYAERLGQRLLSSFDDAISVLEQLWKSRSDIDEWLQHVRRRRELADAGLDGTVTDCVEMAVPAEQLVHLIERAVLEGWADMVSRVDPRVRDTRRQDRDRLVEEFRELDRDLIRLSAARVIERCNELRPVSTVGQAGIIQAQANLRRRHKPIRRLLTEAGDVAKRLKPCFMMSPLSVSSFLPAEISFDVVVFDEASQVRPCDSINCIYRADRLIVAGDQKQLPPTSFFDTRVQDEDGVEDDEAEMQEFDSILDQCKGSGFPSLSLQWHYRSQHESLIAFSNASFYERSLLTFPGAVAHATDLGVERDIVKSCGLAGGRRVAFSGRRARCCEVAEGRVSAKERDQAVVTAAAPAARRAGSARRRSGR
jgi:hypothetical protein